MVSRCARGSSFALCMNPKNEKRHLIPSAFSGGEEGIRILAARCRSVIAALTARLCCHSLPLSFESPGEKQKEHLAVFFCFWRRGRDSNPRYISVHSISSLCVYCLLAFLQSRTVPKKSRLHKGFSDEMTLKGIVRDGSNIISIFPYPSKIRKIGGMFGGMLYYFL